MKKLNQVIKAVAVYKAYIHDRIFDVEFMLIRQDLFSSLYQCDTSNVHY